MESSGKLSVGEKLAYGLGDTASNFFFQAFNIFLAYYYTDVVGLKDTRAVGTLLGTLPIAVAMLNPVIGILADRTQTRWGKFRPWILFTALPWCVVMVLAYTTPKGWSTTAMVAYAAITNILLMSIYSMNNLSLIHI